ncbi:MAG: gliding motility-associated C-terminal domain-containing protein [Saprospiraceae bacterium]|nr:gliding motility-associated C-terminal domain-containing protein [Candidatus Brachybacter algidus]MBL0120510.1 gliding motility-associated C-terminal domain-containing protein [Candidatus Brachybacter algidus]
MLNININIIDEKRSEGDYLICEGDSIRIGSNNYFSEEGNFEQVLTSDSGCDSLILLRISYKDEELCENGVCGKYYIPNVFSPNNDGINDEFEVVVKNVTINYMAIFNRWGGVVFSSNDINPKWNGMFKNLEVNPGVYVYMIRGFCNNNKPIFEYGDITVFR